ncbi:MAG TPA: sugar ABC transporter ATP-binding protein [Planctomycetes bacterium]|nr:sugar ABC transporter ATP-binding protein [Fuerstiella sp.]HIK92589.1 sugar ABC transporter ATP-binding protein [Planctomycetota bacterium]
MSESNTSPLLSVENVTKRFPGVTALNQVSLTLAEGEVLALIGENGAGKSTLMKILAGVQLPDEGQIRVAGVPVRLDSVQTAQANRIALIHQELNLSGNLDVGANIFLGREPIKRGLIDKKKIREDSVALLARVGLKVSPDTIVDALPIGQQQLVEIARALSVDARVLIMDEPTSSLSQHETERLLKVVKDLRSRGVSVIYISHRLGEVRELADRVTVFRDGANAGDLSRDEITHDRMVQLMVGRDISQFYARKPHQPGDVALQVSGLETPANLGHRLSFSVRAGEIVGISGLVGAGRTELLHVLFGVDAAVSGTISVDGQVVRLRSPGDAIQAGIALVPEDRKQQGIILEMAVRTNIGLPGLKQHQKTGGFLNRHQEGKDSAEMIARMRIRTPNERQVVQFLSGGNQQKVVLGKWLAMKPKVLLLDEPTRGIDIGAKQEIYALMEELAEQGVAILFVSSEMEEVIGMSDRTLVMHEGRITGELTRDELTEESIMQLATGNVGTPA